MAVAREWVEPTEPDDPEPPVFVTLREYLEREISAIQKHEYIAGEILAKAGASPGHVAIAADVLFALMAGLRGTDCEANGSDLRVRIAEDGPFFYPDISVTCGEPVYDAEGCLHNPLLIVEVLSPTTSSYDRGEKFRNYRQLPSLRHYLLIEQDRRLVEHYVWNEGMLWTQIGRHTMSGDIVRLSDLGVEIPLAEIYRRVSF